MTPPREDEDTIAHLLDCGEIVLVRSISHDQAFLQRLARMELRGPWIVTPYTLVRRHGNCVPGQGLGERAALAQWLAAECRMDDPACANGTNRPIVDGWAQLDTDNNVK